MQQQRKTDKEEKLSITQQNMLCDLRQKQLGVLVSGLMTCFQRILFFSDSAPYQILDVAKWEANNIRERVMHMSRDFETGFKLFMKQINESESCKSIGKLLVLLCCAHKEFLRLDVTIPEEVDLMHKLFRFLITSCHECPVFLHVQDDKQGTNTERLREKFTSFAAFCLMP